MSNKNIEMPNKEMRTRYEKPTTTTNDIYNILFTNVYNKIEIACNSGNREEAFKLADDYINSFYPIYDIILSKWDEQKIQKLFSGQFRIFPLRCYLLLHCNDISYEEKINKLDDIFEKIKSLGKKFNNNIVDPDMVVTWGTTKDKIMKQNYIRKFLKGFNINNYQNCTRNEIESIKCKFYKYINYAESSNFPIEEHINLLRIFLEFLEAHNLDSDTEFIQGQITIKENMKKSEKKGRKNEKKKKKLNNT